MSITPPEFIENFFKLGTLSFLKIQSGCLGPLDFRTSATGVTVTALKLRNYFALYSFLGAFLLGNGQTE
jgi:hypothetical protein